MRLTPEGNICGRRRSPPNQVLMRMRFVTALTRSIKRLARRGGSFSEFLRMNHITIGAHSRQPIHAVVGHCCANPWMSQYPFHPLIIPACCPDRMFMKKMSIVGKLYLIEGVTTWRCFLAFRSMRATFAGSIFGKLSPCSLLNAVQGGFPVVQVGFFSLTYARACFRSLRREKAQASPLGSDVRRSNAHRPSTLRFRRTWLAALTMLPQPYISTKVGFNGC